MNPSEKITHQAKVRQTPFKFANKQVANKCQHAIFIVFLETTAYHLLVLVKHRDQVITSQLQTTPGCIVEGAITFANLMSLHDLTADFNISLEVYCLKIETNQATNLKKVSYFFSFLLYIKVFLKVLNCIVRYLINCCAV